MALWLMASALANANAEPVQDEALAVSLPLTREFVLNSTETGRDYLIQVAVPSAAPPPEGYPVLYVLDGNARFPLLREARETLTRGGPRGDGSPLLIVGIGYPGAERFAVEARAEDYTPPASHRGRGEEEDESPGRLHGGADRFLDFIERRLKPEIASQYPIDGRQQSLLGHSYGGLFALHVLFTRPECFTNYLAISPSLWWKQRVAFEELETFLASTGAEAAGRRLLIGVGGLEQTPFASERGTPHGERRRANAMVDNARELAQRLVRERPALATTFVVYPGEDHGSVMWPAARQAIEFLGPVQKKSIGETPRSKGLDPH
ncbi:hypothetical protein GCM10027040_24900 [Halomonas shantousis]